MTPTCAETDATSVLVRGSVLLLRWRRLKDPPASAVPQLLGKHDDDAAGAAKVREFVDVLVRRHAAQRMAAVSRGDLQCLIDVVDREGDAVHADLVGSSGLGLDRVWVDVFKEL